MPELFLVVGGRRYSGWKSLRVTRSIESLAGSFALEVSDRWGELAEPWPIMEEDACRVEIEVERGAQRQRTTVIDGFIDKRSISVTKESRALSYTGRDRAAALVDCSALVKGAQVTGKPNSAKWTYRNVTVADFVAAIAKPFDVPVSVQEGLVLAKVPLLVVHPGDSAYEVIARAAAADGVLVVSDAAGGIVITRAGAARTASLIEGSNLLTASVEYDGEGRFHRYLISSQIPGTDEASGEATRIQAEATDEGVRRTNRILLIRPDKGYNTTDARRRADWEARTRAAKAETVTVSVQGWTQPNGTLWPVNALARVQAPTTIGIDGDLLIAQVEYSVADGGGLVTQLRLVRPDAFTPEPKATVKSGDGLWLVKRRSDGSLVEPGKLGP